mmetsp:Transcript_20212/g.43928  ORF Transcript_20212/g.43928 Transcript_20212/m.43928 type:complete len:456 (-) Transcript_20212:878-2245(-)|eukprot:CAMPEP_0172297206 /NCGR_PEP_ID=MMETSP1058-20130122/314_1 /TAXON_ID=83371 /ORGANISM="Detonula confervacea, Strain CCMP 353" /LENGTH=455 /DNA_ID=CAMNT_0013006327 /DNA_START=210 /DNA_END=1577 /DNA_ORIENTATION=-
MSEQFPTVLEIKALAEDYGYNERREEVSCTLFFKETNPQNANCPNLINIFYTTRGIMTQLSHPSQGYNSLWRSSAYDSLETLAMLFENPRAHTGRGYRQAKDAVRGCAKCGSQKKRTEYSANQWKTGPGKAACSECVSPNKGGKNKENGGNGIMEGFPRLSLDALKEHDRELTTKIKHQLERRQFNCPLCPEEGRGKHVFFKRVPEDKPIVKCTKCKKAKQGDCERLYPIPKGEEKGYGHYRCGGCKNTWGSSRAIGNIGQQCLVCELAGNPGQFVRPFRMEVFKSGKGGGIAGGGPRAAGRRMKRAPREPIGEDDEEGNTYGAADQQRYQNRGGNALAGTGGGGVGRSFDWVDVKEEPVEEMAPAASRLSQYKSVQHKCEGCASGMCRNRKLPISGVHDVHDGDTVSTSGSILTNSEIDKSEFIDRDIDFDDWEEDDGAEVWVTLGKNGKMLRG